MIRKMLMITSLVVCSAHAMEEISVHPVTTPEELQQGIKGSNAMVDKMLESSPLTAEQQQEYEQKYREQRIQQILALTNSKNAFFKRGEKIVGFVATHPAPIPNLIIIDKVDLGTDPEHKKTIFLEYFKFIKANYSNAEKVWCPMPKDNEGFEAFIKQAGFTKSDYLDTVHDPKNCQGWERNLTE